MVYGLTIVGYCHISPLLARALFGQGYRACFRARIDLRIAVCLHTKSGFAMQSAQNSVWCFVGLPIN